MGHHGKGHQRTILVLTPQNSHIADDLTTILQEHYPRIEFRSSLPVQHEPVETESLCLLWLENGDEQGLMSIEHVRRLNYQVITMGTAASRDEILAIFRAGARDFVEWNTTGPHCLFQSIEKYLKETQPARIAPRCLSVLGANGGAGATSLVANLGIGLGLQKKQTLLIDLAQRAGDLSSFMNLTPDHSLEELIYSQFELEEELLSQSLAVFNDYVAVLSSREEIEEGNRWAEATKLNQLLEQAIQQHSFTLIDAGGRGPEFVMNLIPVTDLFVIPFQPHLVSLRRARLLLKLLQEAGVEDQEILLVENRHIQNHSLTRHQLEKILRQPIGHTIPEESCTFYHSVNCGCPVLPQEKRTPAGRSLEQLTEIVMDRLHVKTPTAPAVPVSGIRKLVSCLGFM